MESTVSPAGLDTSSIPRLDRYLPLDIILGGRQYWYNKVWGFHSSAACQPLVRVTGLTDRRPLCRDSDVEFEILHKSFSRLTEIHGVGLSCSTYSRMGDFNVPRRCEAELVKTGQVEAQVNKAVRTAPPEC